MVIFIDTNIILDVLLEREPFVNDSSGIWEAVEKNKIRGYISANSITDIFYISKKKHGKRLAFNIIRDMMQIFEIVNIDKNTINEALKSGLDDLEDAIQMVCAKQITAKYLITRNIDDFPKNANIKIMLPKKFLSEIL